MLVCRRLHVCHTVPKRSWGSAVQCEHPCQTLLPVIPLYVCQERQQATPLLLVSIILVKRIYVEDILGDRQDD